MAFSQPAPETRVELSSEEMLNISQTINRQFAPRFSKNAAGRMAFSAQELLAISREIRREFAVQSVELPSRLTLLPIDPRRLYAYWHLAASDLRPEPDQQGVAQALTLRVFTQDEQPSLAEDKPAIDIGLTLPVTGRQGSREIILPAEVKGLSYCAAIGLARAQTFCPLLYSNIATRPTQYPRQELAGAIGVVKEFSLPPLVVSSSIECRRVEEVA